MSKILLHIDNLEISFGERKVVDGASLTLCPGEMLALVGESGSGKSLTAHAVLGLLPPRANVAGSIRFEGRELLGAHPRTLQGLRGSRIGMIFQEPLSALNPLHTIGKQLREAFRLSSPTPKRIAELLEEVGLSHLIPRLDAYPHQLSGGERQRVMIAMAIANDPALLIADEPTTAVDVTVQTRILALLKKLQRERGMALLFITHDLTLVERMAERVAVMQAGRIVETGAVSQVFSTPSHAYTRHLLGSAPTGSAAPLPADAPQVVACEKLDVHFPIKTGLLRRTTGVVKAVEQVSAEVRKGETLGLVGESGSGKTTLGFALLKLLPSQGKIVFLGQDMQTLVGPALKRLRRRMQPVFQDPFGSLNPRMNVRQIIEEGLRVHEPNLTAAERARRVEEALAEVGLEADMAGRYPHAFSGGQRQRIGIARAVVLNPALIVLDEPTSALDLSMQSQIIALLKNLQAKTGIAYIFISHDLRVVRALAHRIAVMRRGEIVETGETQALLAAPREEYTKALINAAFLQH